MSGLNKRTYVLVGLISLSLITWQNAIARLNGNLDYSVGSEISEEDDSELLSILDLSISDEALLANFQAQYALDTSLILDHANSIENQQYTGFFNGQYTFVKPSLWWELSARVDILPVNIGIDIDELSSQTVGTITTGPTISLWKNLRGSVDIKVLSSINTYSESVLDSRKDQVSLHYLYLVSDSVSYLYSIDQQSVTYDDLINSVNDYDLSRASIAYQFRSTTTNYEVVLAHNIVDSLNSSISHDTVDYRLNYLINSSSSLSVSLSNSLQSAVEFNLQLEDRDNSLFQSGLIQNRRIRLSYVYTFRDATYSIQVYNNQVKNVVDTTASLGDISGTIIRYSNEFNEKVSYGVSLEATDNKLFNEVSDEIEFTATYAHIKVKRSSGQLRLIAEFDEVNSIRTNNLILQYRFSSKFF